MYAVLIKYQNINVELEYKSNDNYIDMYIRNNKYNIILELKYLKKTDSSKLVEVKENAIKQINEYSKIFDKNNLRKYIVIFIGSEYTVEEIN